MVMLKASKLPPPSSSSFAAAVLTPRARSNYLYPAVIMGLLFWLLLLSGGGPLWFGNFSSSLAADDAPPIMTLSELNLMIADLRGPDQRLMRWDATMHTSQQQQHACHDLLRAAATILRSADAPLLTAALEYITFCVTDNPAQRSRLANGGGGDNDAYHLPVDRFHGIVSALVTHADPHVSSMASHVVYITAFANKAHQQGWIAHNVVQHLSAVILRDATDTSYLAVSTMWAAAALQNVCANYCDTPDDGRCYYKWRTTANQLRISTDSGTMLSSGETCRQQALTIPGLVTRLQELSCQGPVHGRQSSANPYIGVNARQDRDEHLASIVPWAATGALKNLALQNSASTQLSSSMACYCRMAHSPDWLEENKGGGVLHYLRRNDPCWLDNENDIYTTAMCIDYNFLDQEDYNCAGYDDPTDEECQAADKFDENLLAKAACCGCGGGEKHGVSREEL